MMTVATGSATAAEVTIRVEGATKTLVEQRTVSTTSGEVIKDGTNACSGNSGAGVLEQATGGAWTGTWYDSLSSYSVDSILGENYDFTSTAGRYWALWINNSSSIVGICGLEPSNGDSLMLLPTCWDSSVCDISELPLGLKLNKTALVTGETAEATVVKYATDGTESPAAGVTVEGGASAVTTDSNGKTNVTFNGNGEFTVKASGSGYFRSNGVTACVHSSGDGGCSTDANNKPIVDPITECKDKTNGQDGLCGTVDKTRPNARLTGLTSSRRYSRKNAPRKITWKTEEASGIGKVQLRIQRRVGRKSCSYFNGESLKFKKVRCGKSKYFTVDSVADGSYLLPKRLAKGKYVVDLLVTDKAGNSDTLKTRRNRIKLEVK